MDNETKIITVTCEQYGKKFTGYYTRRFCDECRRLRNIAVVLQCQKRKRRKANNHGDFQNRPCLERIDLL